MLPARHPGQRRVAQSAARFQVLACGRRWGKTHYGAMLAIEAALHVGRAWWVAPTYGMAQVGWRLLKRLADQVPGTRHWETSKLIVFGNGGTVQVRSADQPDTLRGEGLDFVVLDEAAYMDERAWREALRPALADRLGRALFISTPNGRNWFWQLYERGRDPAYPDWRSWRLPTADNPAIAESEIEAAQRSLPSAVFRQEFLAEFLDSGQGVFRGLDEALGATAQTGRIGGHRYTLGIDWGKLQDFSAFAVYDETAQSLVHLTRLGQMPYQQQLVRLRDVVERFQPDAILAERNSIGEPLLEQLQDSGLPVQGFTTTATTKRQLIEHLALAIERRALRLPDEPVLLAELRAFETQRTPGGHLSYGAPPGQHDDTVMALALAVWAARLGAHQQHTVSYLT